MMDQRPDPIPSAAAADIPLADLAPGSLGAGGFRRRRPIPRHPPNWGGAWRSWAFCPARPCASSPGACWRGRRSPCASAQAPLRCDFSRLPVSAFVRSSRSSPRAPMDAAPSAPSPLIALVGNPNCGKTALFNILTGSRQKVANYAGVTVERKEGSLLTPSGLRGFAFWICRALTASTR